MMRSASSNCDSSDRWLMSPVWIMKAGFFGNAFILAIASSSVPSAFGLAGLSKPTWLSLICRKLKPRASCALASPMMPSECGTPPDTVHSTPVPTQVIHSRTLRRLTPSSRSNSLIALTPVKPMVPEPLRLLRLPTTRLGESTVYSRPVSIFAGMVCVSGRGKDRNEYCVMRLEDALAPAEQAQSRQCDGVQRRQRDGVKSSGPFIPTERMWARPHELLASRLTEPQKF